MAPHIPSTDTGGSPSKSVLICPTCDHENPPDGDWFEHRCETASGQKIALVCPECEAEITYRRAPEDRPRERAASSVTR